MTHNHRRMYNTSCSKYFKIALFRPIHGATTASTTSTSLAATAYVLAFSVTPGCPTTSCSSALTARGEARNRPALARDGSSEERK